MIELKNILIKPPLRIRFCAGKSDRLVVCFSGVGKKRREEPPVEFFKIVGGGGRNPTLFVSDQSRSWLNSEGMASDIVGAIAAKATELGTKELVFVGNSMGGTVALQIARLMPVDRVVALTPQYSVNHKAVPEEKRWAFFRDRISEYPFLSVDAWPETGIVFVVHGSTENEMIHARRFPDTTDNVDHYILAGCGHDLAAHLRQRGELAGLVSNMMDARRWRVRKKIQDLGGTRRWRYLESVKKAESI